MHDFGTARADFPGGDAGDLYRSIRRLLSLPRETRLFLCNDYKAPGRDTFAWETTVGVQRDTNVHVNDGVGEEAFVALRTERDKTLAMPKLIMPAIQGHKIGKASCGERRGTYDWNMVVAGTLKKKKYR